MTTEQTAIIESVKVGQVERLPGLVITCSFKLREGAFENNFSPKEILEMMDDCKVYDDVQKLIGKPCQVMAGWGERCEFLEMWKK